ncbi:MAG: D-Ala-D-Ala carboxypeptidase family metallohydrolase [Bacteroidales bacterium]
MKHFSISECTRSETATAKGIDNTPQAEHLAHIVEAIETLLDPLREAWAECCLNARLGTPGIRISSGYRGPALNAAVGGSTTSAHCHGYAFDLIPLNEKMTEFKNFCRKFLDNRPFDQLISEGENKDGLPSWMHVGYKSPHGEQRRQFLSMRDGKYFAMTT